MIVTPGIDLEALEGPYTKHQINLLGRPTVALETGDVTPDMVDIDALTAALGSGIAGVNYLQNGNFAEPLWSRGSTPVSCAAGLRTYRADDWAVMPAGAAVTYEREQNGPNFRSLHSAKITGASSVTTVDFLQDIPAHLGAALATKITVSFYLLNNTGADVTPLVRIDTADSLNNFGAVTNRFSQSVADAVTTGNWKRWTLTIDATSFANMENGVRLVIRIPSGALNNGSKSVNFSQIKLEVAETATAFIVDPAERADAGAAPSTPPRNFFENGAMSLPRWFSTSLTTSENVDNYALDGWWVRPGGASGLVIDPLESAPDTLSIHCARLTGATGVSQVDFGQNLYQVTTAEMRRPMMVSFQIYNGTGASITPTLRIETCDADNDFSTVTQRASTALDVCPNGAWTRVSFAFTGDDYTNWTNGARISLRFASGTLDGGSKTIRITQARCETGTEVTAYNPGAAGGVAGTAVPSTFERLTITRVDDNQITVTASNLVLKSPSSRAVVASAISATANLNSSGANGLDTGSRTISTWYYVWAISDGSNHRAVFSTSGTAATMPAGYNFMALIGAVYNDSSNHLRDFRQVGRKIYQVPVLVYDNSMAASDTYQTADAGLLATALPPLASNAWGSAGVSKTYGTGSAECEIDLAPSASRIGEVSIHGKSVASAANKYYFSGSWTLPIITAQTIYIKAIGTSIKYRVEVAGFEL
jgi:hypothetical protein